MLFTSYTFRIHTTTHARTHTVFHAISNEIDFWGILLCMASDWPVRTPTLTIHLTCSFGLCFGVGQFIPIPCDHLFSIILTSHLSSFLFFFFFCWVCVVVVAPFNYLFVYEKKEEIFAYIFCLICKLKYTQQFLVRLSAVIVWWKLSQCRFASTYTHHVYRSVSVTMIGSFLSVLLCLIVAIHSNKFFTHIFSLFHWWVGNTAILSFSFFVFVFRISNLFWPFR